MFQYLLPPREEMKQQSWGWIGAEEGRKHKTFHHPIKSISYLIAGNQLALVLILLRFSLSVPTPDCGNFQENTKIRFRVRVHCHSLSFHHSLIETKCLLYFNNYISKLKAKNILLNMPPICCRRNKMAL